VLVPNRTEEGQKTGRNSGALRRLGEWLGRRVTVVDTPSPGAKSILVSGSGITFVGAPDTRRVIRLNEGGATREADALTRQTALATSLYCFTAAWWRASRVSEPPLMVVRETEEGEEWLPGHELAPLLSWPRPDVEMGELLALSQYFRDVTGATLWVTDRDAAARRALVTPFHKEQFRVGAAPPLIYGRYEVRTDRGTWRPVDVDTVTHFRDPNPWSWYEPLSRVDVALGWLDLGHNVERIVRRYLLKAMFPGGIISPDEEWDPDPEAWAEFKSTVEQWLSGPANAGDPLVLQGGTTFSRAAVGLQELLPDPLLDRVEACVGSAFGVPPVVLGWLSGMKNSPWSQMAEARRQVYEDTIEPIWRDIEKRLTRTWLSEEERADGLLVKFDTAGVRALKADEESRARVASLNARIWRVDERRLFTGKEPLPAGDPRGDVIEGLSAEGEEEPTAPFSFSLDHGPDAKLDERDLAWVVFDVQTKAAASTWEKSIASFLNTLAADLTAALRKFLREEDVPEPVKSPRRRRINRDSAAEFELAMGELLDQSRPKLAALAYPLVLSTGAAGVRRAAARLGLSFDVLQPGLLKFAEAETAFLASVMGESTGRAVVDAVQKGLAEGDTVRQLTQRLEGLPEFSRDRARLVARTETTRAWNGAQRRSMSEYSRSHEDKLVHKVWVSSRDDRVRDEHRELDGQQQLVDELFTNGLQQPGEPNCRCTLVYQITDTATAGAGAALPAAADAGGDESL
jgi:SPP1 gp7 family putative phage head morphogenesis protein